VHTDLPGTSRAPTAMSSAQRTSYGWVLRAIKTVAAGPESNFLPAEADTAL
jgi:hypothetical protein